MLASITKLSPLFLVRNKRLLSGKNPTKNNKINKPLSTGINFANFFVELLNNSIVYLGVVNNVNTTMYRGLHTNSVNNNCLVLIPSVE